MFSERTEILIGNIMLLFKCCNRKSVFYLRLQESQVKRKLRNNAVPFLVPSYIYSSVRSAVPKNKDV